MMPMHAAKRKVHTIGDSTMSSYKPAATPKRGWGMYLQAFFNPDSVEVNNRGKSGASTRTFYETENLWPSVKKQMSAGDYLIIQFAHNDEKCKGEDVYEQNAKLRAEGKDTLTDMRGTEPNTTYKAYLRKYINEARALGVTPILMSPICRAYFLAPNGHDSSKDGQINDEGRHLLAGVKELTNEGVKDKDYVRCMREVAEEMNVPFLDMTKRSKEFFEFAGQEVCMSQYFNCGDKTHTGAAGGMVVAMQAYMLIMWSNIDELKSWMIFPNLDEFHAYAQRIEDEGRQAELNAPGERFTDSKLLPNRTENIDIAQGQYYIAQGGAWPAGEIDEVANRYLEYEVTPISPKKPYVVEQIVVPVRATGGDGMNIHINYGFGDAFASVTTVYENTALPNDKEIIVRINQQILVPVGQTLKIRVLPWYDSNGAPQSGKYIYLGEMQVTYKQQIKLKAAP